MPFLELWSTYLLPVIRYLIGPIIVGVVVYYLTNRKKYKLEREKTIRQLNILQTKLNRIIFLVDESSKEVNIKMKYQEVLRQMNHGDFSGVEDEYKISENKMRWLHLYQNMNESSHKSINKLNKQIKSTYLELRDMQSDLLPPEIHAKFVDLVEGTEIELDLTNYRKLLEKVKKAL